MLLQFVKVIISKGIRTISALDIFTAFPYTGTLKSFSVIIRAVSLTHSFKIALNMKSAREKGSTASILVTSAAHNEYLLLKSRNGNK